MHNSSFNLPDGMPREVVEHDSDNEAIKENDTDAQSRVPMAKQSTFKAIDMSRQQDSVKVLQNASPSRTGEDAMKTKERASEVQNTGNSPNVTIAADARADGSPHSTVGAPDTALIKAMKQRDEELRAQTESLYKQF